MNAATSNTKQVLKTKEVTCKNCGGHGQCRQYADEYPAYILARCYTCGGKGYRHLGNDGQYYMNSVDHSRD